MQKTPLDSITSLLTKEKRLVCGLMSGTSVDGISAALVEIAGGGAATRVRVLGFSETPFPEETQAMILANAEASTSSVRDLCVLHALLARLYADAVTELCVEAGPGLVAVDLIGMHGQTVHHLPAAVRTAGHDVRGTLQIGSGAALAALLGVPVVSDFRAADMAAGGQGAPLVPYVDYVLFRSAEEHRVLVNIGGIANVTVLPRDCGEDAVLACDSGPGNMVIDALMRRFYGKEFDESGVVARSGNVNSALLGWCLSHPYFERRLPKSTGREDFGAEFVAEFVQFAAEFGVHETADLIATASELTVRALSREILALVPAGESITVILSGGGAKNKFLRDGLRLSLPNSVFMEPDAFGIRGQEKEAVAFAVLANEWLHGNPANLPRVTGASRKILLGSFAI